MNTARRIHYVNCLRAFTHSTSTCIGVVICTRTCTPTKSTYDHMQHTCIDACTKLRYIARYQTLVRKKPKNIKIPGETDSSCSRFSCHQQQSFSTEQDLHERSFIYADRQTRSSRKKERGGWLLDAVHPALLVIASGASCGDGGGLL